ncbi:hypothetical protein [Jannaschia donghaensis]|uniref:Uncharacterized protein n=1 Tax=Jannaschia donghaensis TaxID=420998 RepID=A0A0M6YM30_9RHOB|nr:hypothetical protein [Jannaschia donghaensis]CTQ51421.1 hypothetical protein JDO7802_03460 [Jannaschia donghaensis]
MLSIFRPLRRRSSFLYALLGAGVLAAIALILDGLFGGTGSEIPAWRRAIVVAAL